MEATRPSPRELRFGMFSVDLKAGELRKQGHRIRLQEQPFQVLAMLLERSGEVVTREELRGRLWAADTFVDFDHGLNIAINKLREALGDSAEEPHFIETLPRRGYRFIAKVNGAELEGWTGKSLDREPSSSSIAMLPFLFLSEADERRSLSLGFADALITMLGSLGDIVVAPTSSILNYPAGTDPVRACRDLGVRYVLQGNIQTLGAHWRVSIQLFDAVTQKIALAEKYDFAMEDIFEVQDEIGRRVVESLQRFFPPALRKSRDRYTSDTEAYDEFISGLRESYSDRPEAIESAIKHLSRAVECDAEFAVAYAVLSYVCTNMYYSFDSHRRWLERAEYCCARALKLDPELPEGHLARAYILWSPAKNFQHAEAIAALEKVLAVQPNLERAHNRLATICAHIGRLKEARIAHEHGQRANPKRLLSRGIIHVYLWGGDFARAAEVVEDWLRESPGNKYALWFHPQPALLAGDLPLAAQLLETASAQLPDEPLIVSLRALLHARRGESQMAADAIRSALEFPRSFGHTHHTYYQIACTYAVLGETEKAMAWLGRSVGTGFACWPFFQVDPHLENLHRHPEFQQLVDDLKREFAALKIQRL